jgi:hypothetical protein
VYFPVFRTKTHELIALRQMAQTIADKSIIPVLEPVCAAASLRPSIKAFVEAEMLFALIVNPIYPEKRSPLTPRQVYEDIIRDSLDEADFYPTMYVTRTTRAAEIDAFSSVYSELGMERVYFLLSDPRERALNAILEDAPAYALLRAPHVSEETRDRFAGRVRVHVDDPFRRLNKNADYPPEDFFSDRHVPRHDAEFGHYGDYSIVGDHFQEGGGLPFAVALHHMVKARRDGGNLLLRHFVSDSNATRQDTPGKFLEALRHLIEALPEMGNYNHTTAADEYRDLYKRRHYPGLGVPKRLGIVQHLSIVADLL